VLYTNSTISAKYTFLVLTLLKGSELLQLFLAVYVLSLADISQLNCLNLDVVYWQPGKVMALLHLWVTGVKLATQLVSGRHNITARHSAWPIYDIAERIYEYDCPIVDSLYFCTVPV
jgi:hypothetical protein